MKKLIWTLIIGLALWSCSGNLLNNPLGSVTVSISAGPTLINGVDTMGISWNTNVASRHMVEYGTVSGTYTKASPATSVESKDHLETLIDLVPSTKYYYRITSFYQTSFQKVSQEYSFTTNAFTQPSGITVTPSTTSATVIWTTSLSAKGSIDLGTATGVYDLSTPAEALSGTVHTQTISGLLPNTAYFFRLKSQYPNGLIDTHTLETTFTTSAVALVGLPTAVADQTSVSITWTTDSLVNHGVDYGTAPGIYSNSTVPTTSASASHSVAISNLAANTTYYYRLKSLLSTGTTVNHPESSFTTGVINLVAAPTIVLSPTDAVLTWSTNVATSYIIETGTATGVYTQSSPKSTTSVADHTHTLSNLIANKKYFYRIVSYLPSGVSVAHAEGDFTTTNVTFAVNPAVTPTSTSGDISWTTNVSTTYTLEFGLSSGVYSTATPESATTKTVQTHSLTGLLSNKTYFYRIKSILPTGGVVIHSESSFATAAVTITGVPGVTPQATGADITWTTSEATNYSLDYGTTSGVYTTSVPVSLTPAAPHTCSLTGLRSGTTYYYRITTHLISGEKITDSERSFSTSTLSLATGPTATPSTTSASLAWTSSATTKNIVEWGTVTGTYTNATTLSGSFDTAQTASITGLLPATQYFYRIKSYLSTGEIVTHTEGNFTTLAVSLTVGPVATPGSTSASIAWTTSIATNYTIDYGTSTGSYSQSTPATTSATTGHTHNLTSLTANTPYFYRIRSLLTNGETVSHAEATFTTTAVSITVGPSATPDLTSGLLTWTTSVATKNIVEWGTVTGTYTNSTTITGSFITAQSVSLTGLQPSTQYFYSIKSYLSTGEIVTHPEGNFTTTAFGFTVNPSASGITTTSGDISWTTNLAAKSIVDYGTSTGVYTSSLGIDAAATTAHTRTLSALTPGTLYYYRIRNFTANNGDFTSGESTFTTTAEPEPTLAKKLRGIWMVGGLSGNLVSNVATTLDLYDPVTNLWHGNVAAAATGTFVPVSFAGAASWKNTSTGHHQIYVFGGFNSAGTPQTLVQIYDIENNEWTTGTAMTGARANIVATRAYNKFYIMGGTSGTAATAWTAVTLASLTTIYEYTPGSTWATRASLAATVSERMAWSYNDVIYHLGGRSAAAAVAGSAAIGYSVTGNAATAAILAIPAARTGGALALWTPSDGPARVFLVGGFSVITGNTGNLITVGTSANTALQTTHYLNFPFTTPYASWTTNATYNYPIPVGFGSAAVYGNKLYYFGGTASVVTASASGLAAVYSLDLLALNTWSNALDVPNMTTARYGHTAVTIQQ